MSCYLIYPGISVVSTLWLWKPTKASTLRSPVFTENLTLLTLLSFKIRIKTTLLTVSFGTGFAELQEQYHPFNHKKIKERAENAMGIASHLLAAQISVFLTGDKGLSFFLPVSLFFSCFKWTTPVNCGVMHHQKKTHDSFYNCTQRNFHLNDIFDGL